MSKGMKLGYPFIYNIQSSHLTIKSNLVARQVRSGVAMKLQGYYKEKEMVHVQKWETVSRGEQNPK